MKNNSQEEFENIEPATIRKPEKRVLRVGACAFLHLPTMLKGSVSIFSDQAPCTHGAVGTRILTLSF